MDLSEPAVENNPMPHSPAYESRDRSPSDPFERMSRWAVRVFSDSRDKDSSAGKNAPAQAVIAKANRNAAKSSNFLMAIMGMIQKRGSSAIDYVSRCRLDG